MCDIIRGHAEAVAEVLDHPFITTDRRELTDKVDAVLIVLPHYPGIRKLKELLDSGEYGRIMQMSVWTEQLTKHEETEWLCTARLGGGQLFSHGCHYIDAMLRILGKPVKGFHVGTRVGTPWLMREGTSALVLSFEKGALGYHGATWGARGTKMGYDWQIMTERGLLELDRYNGERIRFYDGIANHVPGVTETRSSRVIWERDDGTAVTKDTYFEIDHFADCVLNGKKPITDGETALKSLQLIWALYDGEKNNYVPDLSQFDLGEENHENYRSYIKEMNEKTQKCK